MSNATSTTEQIATHTPGPWEVEDGDVVATLFRGKTPVTIGGEERFAEQGLIALVYTPIASVRGGREAYEAVSAANTSLIAAAPDLLQALKDVLAQFDAGAFVRNTDSDGCSDWAIRVAGPLRALAVAKVAVAKAEGRQS